MANREQIMTASGLNIIAAIWLVISPFVLGFTETAAATNNYIVGIIVGVLALIKVMSPRTMAWPSWLNIILGLWLIISPFFLGFITVSALWNNIILGIIVAALAAWSSASAPHQTQA
jgi:hypothetical protein